MNLEIEIKNAYHAKTPLSVLARGLGMSRSQLRKTARQLGLDFSQLKSHRSMNEKRYVGKRYGKLEILSFAGYRDGVQSRFSLWNALCDCGTMKQVSSRQLDDNPNRGIKSCGCYSPKNRTGEKHASWTGYKEIPGDFWNRIKRSAKYKGREFSITIEEAYDLYLKQRKHCALSGRVISFTTGNLASLDRIDSKKDYVLGNVQWLDHRVNIMKSSMTTEEFLDLCRDICERL